MVMVLNQQFHPGRAVTAVLDRELQRNHLTELFSQVEAEALRGTIVIMGLADLVGVEMEQGHIHQLMLSQVQQTQVAVEVADRPIKAQRQQAGTVQLEAPG